MKVTVISDNFPSRWNMGNGIFVYNFVRELANLGCDVVVISPTSLFYLFRYKKIKTFKDDCVVYRPWTLTFSEIGRGKLNTYHLGSYLTRLILKRFIAREVQNSEVVYFHFTWNYLTHYSTIKRFDVKTILVVGEYKRLFLMKQIYSQKFLKEALNHLTVIVAVSAQIKEALVQLFDLPEEKIIIEHNVAADYFQPLDQKISRIRLSMEVGTPKALFVGRFVEDKGITVALRATEQSGVDLSLVGRGYFDLSGFDHTKLLGSISNHELPHIYSAHDFLILPTLHEGSCNAIAEAMACGIWIITSNIEPIREQLSRYDRCVLCEPKDIEAFVGAINYVLECLSVSNEKSRRNQGEYAQRVKRILNSIEN